MDKSNFWNKLCINNHFNTIYFEQNVFILYYKSIPIIKILFFFEFNI